MDSTAGVGGRCRYEGVPTEELAQEIAEKAHILGSEGQRVETSALARSYRELKDHLTEEAPFKVGPHVLDHLLGERAVAGAEAGIALASHAAAVGVGAAAHSFSATYALFEVAIVEAHERGAKLNNATINDAIGMALTVTLELHEDFRHDFCFPRRQSEKGASAVSAALVVPLKDMVPILKKRCDDGMRAALHAYPAVKNVPESERLSALTAELTKRGYGDLVQHDIAFGLGVRYLDWIERELPVPARKRELDALRKRDARNEAQVRVCG
jgi:hypothetical protein